jgi:DNA repair exonuclease SbcCD ATPase subunit
MSRRVNRRASDIILDTAIDSDSWKKDKNCVSCNKNFEKNGLSHALKFLCKFCLKGVCPDCSENRLTHLRLGPNQRACNLCYLIHKPLEVPQDLSIIYQEKSQELDILKLKLEKISQIHQKEQDFIKEIQNSIETYNQQQIQLDIELNELNTQIQNTSNKLKTHQVLPQLQSLIKKNSDLEKKIEEVTEKQNKAKKIQMDIEAKENELQSTIKIREMYVDLISKSPVQDISPLELALEMQIKTNKELEDELTKTSKYFNITEEQPQKRCCSFI